MINLEEIKEQYENAKSLDYDPDLFMGKAQSLLENLLKLNYQLLVGKPWIQEYGDMSNLVETLWSNDNESIQSINQARKIRNKYAHEGAVTDDEAINYSRTIDAYIAFIEAGNLQNYEKSGTNLREENTIKRRGFIITFVGAIIILWLAAYFGQHISNSIPILGPIVGVGFTLIIGLFTFLYVARRYAFFVLIAILLFIFTGGIALVLLFAVALIALFYISRYFINKWLGWYVYSYMVNTWWFILSQFPFSLFANSYINSQERKAQAEREDFQKQQQDYAEKSQKVYEEWEKQHSHNENTDSSHSESSYTPYTVLGVTPDTPMNEIKKAYRSLAKAYHPDLNKEPNAVEKFKEIQEAWEAINNFKK
ncbi:DnaJ domain-containing protein [Lactococcus nasutitermitis]|uniref:DnaJ domain-containing protein n=1 Tax=Lactococcus nasutitermitis TaxID=1652957 RepID=A0ABV9JBF2_9LACT|nr:tetraspanin family protein [Lactococcus nasutitermitis]